MRDFLSKDDARLERLQGMLRQRGILLPAFDMYGGAKGLYDLDQWVGVFAQGSIKLAQSLAVNG